MSGPHLWVLLVSLIYLFCVLFSCLRLIRLNGLSGTAKVLWFLAVVMVPMGGLVAFWAFLAAGRKAKDAHGVAQPLDASEELPSTPAFASRTKDR